MAGYVDSVFLNSFSKNVLRHHTTCLNQNCGITFGTTWHLTSKSSPLLDHLMLNLVFVKLVFAHFMSWRLCDINVICSFICLFLERVGLLPTTHTQC